MKHIFVSYAREDRDCAEQLAMALEAEGRPVWWDREILGGLNVHETISEALEAAACVIVLWSRNSIESDWVKDEAEVGREKRILVPIRIEDVKIPLGFGQIHTESLEGWAGEPDHPGLQRVIRAVNATYERSAATEDAGVQEQPPEVTEPRVQPIDEAGPRAREREDRKEERPVEAEESSPEQPIRLRQLITTRVGLSTVLGLLFLFNWLETTFETTIGRAVLPGSAWRDQFTYAMHWLESYFSFESHDLTNMVAVYGYSIAYFVIFPVLVALVGIALARRNDIKHFRVFVFSATIDYLVSLPFFLMMPVPERWYYPDSDAMLLSDMWDSRLIESFRPFSGLDNCFPSFHTSLTVIIVALCFIYRMRFRWSVLFLGSTIVLSTLVLGIHWAADVTAGIAVGILSVALARGLERKLFEAGNGWLPDRGRPATAKRIGLTSCLLAVATMSAAPSAAAQDSLSFLGVAYSEDVREADDSLRQVLARTADIAFLGSAVLDTLGYEETIDTLVAWPDTGGPFLARTTPYVFVSAEMLGAHLEVVGVYESASTGGTTYHSYFVVHRDSFPHEAANLTNLKLYIQSLSEGGNRATFIYHSRFSTSSYFLPSLFFRKNRIFSTEQPREGITPIRSVRFDTESSKDLVRQVALGDYELAAVWDGTKNHFTGVDAREPEPGQNVHFIKNPTALPNDLLVVPEGLDARIRQNIEAAIERMDDVDIGVGDYLTWRPASSNEGKVALEALAELQMLARERPAAAIVQINDESLVEPELREAAELAVELSGTEFVIHNPDYHGWSDYLWTLESIHDGAIRLTSDINGLQQLDSQVFQISFDSPEDLTRRISTLMKTRMHRIRYLWPYKGEPTIIRDVDFAIPPGDTVWLREIEWVDPTKSEFALRGRQRAFEVETADLHKFKLRAADLELGGGSAAPGLDPDPMSNIAYRVVLMRPDRERLIFKVATIAFIALLVLAAVAALLLDLRLIDLSFIRRRST